MVLKGRYYLWACTYEQAQTTIVIKFVGVLL